jgi:dGTPase
MSSLGQLHVRELTESLEKQMLHAHACFSSESLGREKAEDLCLIRTAFQRDRDRILHSKAFRRLKHKTQVFIAPVGDHYRTRLTHSLEVAQISRTIARALRLNEDLTESIALGHDLGHPPFGHTGERMLNELSPFGYHHQQQSLRIAKTLEQLNLTVEVLDGIEGITSTKSQFLTLEAQIVDIADRMAYLHHDVEDARRAGLMAETDLPLDIIQTLGKTRQARLDRMVLNLVQNSLPTLNTDTPQISLSADIYEAVMALRKWMFENVYLSKPQLAQADQVRRVLTELYEFYLKNPEKMTSVFPEDASIERNVLDYIAGMTDRFAIAVYKRHLLPHPYQPFIFQSAQSLECEVAG